MVFVEKQFEMLLQYSRRIGTPIYFFLCRLCGHKNVYEKAIPAEKRTLVSVVAFGRAYPIESEMLSATSPFAPARVCLHQSSHA